MFFNNKQVLVSVCIPVYNTEKYLKHCLQSVASQNFYNSQKTIIPFEIIVVDDGSPGVDEEGNDCGQIVREFGGKVSFPVKYIDNKENLMLFETRRNAVLNASGKYVMFLDSDDELLPDAIQKLYQSAVETQSDVVHAKTKLVAEKNIEPKIFSFFSKKTELIYYGSLDNESFRKKYFFDSVIHGFVWSKLYSRELLLTSYDMIPSVRCNFTEDLLLSFFICLNAKKYTGIDFPVYAYHLNIGMSAKEKIDTLQKWEGLCSSSGVWAIIFDWMNNNAVSQELIKKMHEKCNSALLNIVKCYIRGVTEEIKEAALEMLYDYWGKDYVDKVFSYIESNNLQALS